MWQSNISTSEISARVSTSSAQWQRADWVSEYNMQVKMANDTMKKQAKELEKLFRLISDGHSLVRMRRARMLVEGVFLEELRAKLLQELSGHVCEPPVSASQGAGGPPPDEHSDLQVLRIAMRGILDGMRQHVYAPGLQSDAVAIASLLQSLARNAGVDDPITAPWLQPLLTAARAQEAARWTPNEWEACD
mmetsp:Transcript_104819/g.291929  ORF Transcript_104819/g.291929 Transcript_104819/m.291929 type:complete len:191 (-) Transcript_104819:229-801(-)|eukprot:CAMPEP_0179159972 /NCGR_PEP_ID=MMETSP0796-20121207/78165_1 /TAXON_ID=73915 /ORGANISM="Pyrodinium bahamense, Strain pbaha01" /LENGTH=190 /DNA_ID=CAMNT_0020861819 /DNA_START=1 /DNA_END=573 /DNA_ORIENTATION=-